MKHCVILGYKSDIAQGLLPFLGADGWSINGWQRDHNEPQRERWGLVIVALGAVAPVGAWYDLDKWEDCFYSNVILPMKLLKGLWHLRKENSAVCFLTGSNPQKPMFGYAPYNAAKMAVNKVVEQLYYETPDSKFFALGPGYMDTKIHKPTKDANWYNPRIEQGNPTKIEKVYECLKWCINQPREVIGGRNICVSDNYGPELAERLKANPNLFKLRRIE